MKIGYARVSTVDQSLNLQIDALKADGCEMIFSEQLTGTNRNRPELIKMMAQLRKGDTVVIWKLDRLGRSVKDIVDITGELHIKDVDLKSIVDKIDTSSPMGRFFFHIMGAMAEFQADQIKENTKAGLAAARSRGRVGGRRKGITPVILEKAKVAKSLFENKSMPISAILKHLNVSRTTFYKLLKL